MILLMQHNSLQQRDRGAPGVCWAHLTESLLISLSDFNTTIRKIHRAQLRTIVPHLVTFIVVHSTRNKEQQALSCQHARPFRSSHLGQVHRFSCPPLAFDIPFVGQAHAKVWILGALACPDEAAQAQLHFHQQPGSLINFPGTGASACSWAEMPLACHRERRVASNNRT
jgi:hypothetical protein